jgi:hypothetical protein
MKPKCLSFIPKSAPSKEIMSIWYRRTDSGPNRNNLHSQQDKFGNDIKSFWFRFQNDIGKFVLSFLGIALIIINLEPWELITLKTDHTLMLHLLGLLFSSANTGAMAAPFLRLFVHLLSQWQVASCLCSLPHEAVE